MQNRLKILLPVLLMALGLAGITPAAAQSANTSPGLPSSSNPASGKWAKMTPSSFPGTIRSAKEQCLRDVAADRTGQVTVEKCALLERMLSSGQCAIVMVPDKIVHDIMNGRVNGRSVVTHNVEKRLGRLDQATLCDLGDGVHAYWYTGVLKVSCNNVAFSFVTPPPASQVADVPPKPKCHYVTRTRQTQSTGGLSLSAVYLPGCDCCGPFYAPGLWVPPSAPDNTTETILACEK